MQQPASLLLEVRDASGQFTRHLVEGDGYLIGRGDFCDLWLDDAGLPLVHSEIHVQEGAVWIEAVDAAAVEINGKPVPRFALRSGDVLRLGTISVTIWMGTDAQTAWQLPADGWEDLSQLSALELCERIEAEEAAIHDDERRHWQGIEALLVTLESLLRTDRELVVDDQRTENVVQQLQALSEALATRTQQLADQEQQFLNTASEIKQSQEDMARRLESMIHQIDPGDLRASA